MADSRQTVLEAPIFVVGPLRSGTTMLRLMVGAHSNINCFGEFEYAVSQYEGNRPPELAAYHQFLSTDRQALSHKLDVDKSLDYLDLVNSFLSQWYDRNPVDLVGASIHSRIDVVPDIWPKVKLIHLLRDPRDVARSCIGMGWVGNVYEGARYWLHAEKGWELAQAKLPSEQKLEVRYEDLVAQPEQVLTRICEFLGVEYQDRMIDLDSISSYSKPDPKYAQQWKRKLSSEQIKWVEARCGDMMIQRGYPAASGATPEPLNPLYSKWLKLDSKIKTMLGGVKRYGFGLWFCFGLTKALRLRSLNHSLQMKKNEINARFLK